MTHYETDTCKDTVNLFRGKLTAIAISPSAGEKGENTQIEFHRLRHSLMRLYHRSLSPPFSPLPYVQKEPIRKPLAVLR